MLENTRPGRLTQRLSCGARMTVVGRTSSFQFRGADNTMRKVANDLKFRTFLDGNGKWPDCADEVPYDFRSECAKVRDIPKANLRLPDPSGLAESKICIREQIDLLKRRGASVRYASSSNEKILVTRGRQSLLEELEQGRPMAFRCALVEDRQIRNCKAVPRARIGLDHVVHAGVGQRLFGAGFLLVWKTGVFDRARHIHASVNTFDKVVRAIWLVGS
jgi:hypothetical protein